MMNKRIFWASEAGFQSLLVGPRRLDDSYDKILEHLIGSVSWKKQLVNPVCDAIFSPP